MQNRTNLNTPKSSALQGLPDYNTYNFSLKEKIIYFTQSFLIISVFAYIFYRSFIALLLLLILIPFLMKKKKEKCIIRQKQKLSYEFKEMMESIIANLMAGYSVENSFISSYQDMNMLFGEKSLISKELLHISKGIRNNKNVEDLLHDFGKRSHISDISDFAEIFKIAKRSGGNLPNIIKRTSTIIGDKIEIRQKIDTVISSKKYEQSIMNIVPFGIILYIDMTSPGFFNSLYHNLLGYIIMTILLVIYILAYLLAEKITNISV